MPWFRRTLCLLVALATIAAGRAECPVHPGDTVVLFGSTDDPDVFIWDSRFRLRDYEAGSFDQMNALLPHAVLARPGTRAVVESCVENFVQSKYLHDPDHAVGIKILGGPLRGERGWVVGAAIRPARAPRRQP